MGKAKASKARFFATSILAMLCTFGSGFDIGITEAYIRS